MKLVLIVMLCFWSVASQAASQAYELYSQNKNHNIYVNKDSKSAVFRESLAFNGWYSPQLKSGSGFGFYESPFFTNGDDNLTATKFLMLDSRGGVEALFVKVGGKLTETQDAELIKSTLKELISSRKKELETQVGEGEPEVYMFESGSCAASQAAEANLLKTKVPHVVMRTGLANVGYVTAVKNAESFNCLSESEFVDWANKKTVVKQKVCGKKHIYDALAELRTILDAIAVQRGRNLGKNAALVSPVDFTQEMSGNW